MRCHLHTLLLSALLSPLMAQVAVVHPAVPETAMDAKRMTALLQGRISIWGDGTPVVLVFAQDPLADRHLNHVAGRDREVLLRGWKRVVFAGSGAMPLIARSAEEGLALVAKTPGAVLLLDHADADPKWRILPIMLTAER
jgi:hypothetical protein